MLNISLKYALKPHVHHVAFSFIKKIRHGCSVSALLIVLQEKALMAINQFCSEIDLNIKMKTDLKNFSTTTKIILSLIAITLTITACKKDFNNDPIEAAGIGFVHASPGTGALDFILDNQKINSFTYTKDLGYYAAYPGIRVVGVAKKDTLKYLTYNNATLKSGSFYSVFVVDTLKSTKLLILEDDLKAPETDKAKVRFVNLSPGSAPFDLAIAGTDAPLFTAKAFKEFTTFSNIAPNDSYTFQLKQGGAVKVSLPAVKIEKGKIYTIWAKGLSSKTDSTGVGLSVMTNK